MLSIIIPTFNEEKYLPSLLESIKKQKFGTKGSANNKKDYEVIVADAASKDNTVNIAKKYGCIIVKGGLLPKGRNNGAKAAKGDIFLFLDADTILPPSFLKNALRKFKKEHLGVAGFTLFPLSKKNIDKIAFNVFNKWSVLTQKVSPHAATGILVTRKAHEAVGGFDESITFIEDYPYSRAVSKIAKYGFIHEPLFTSTRRYQKDGRLKTYIKYFLGELHTVFLGPIRSDIFNYKFGHYKDEK